MSKIKIPASVLTPVQKFLQKKLNKLQKQKERVAQDDPFSDPGRTIDNAADDTEAAEQFGHARAQAIKKALEAQIIQVKKALARIKIGKYGICEKCGRFIDTKRLMIYPETTLCARCAQKKAS